MRCQSTSFPHALVLLVVTVATAAAEAASGPVPAPEPPAVHPSVVALQSAPAATAYMVAKLEMLDTAMVRVARLETATQKIHERANVIFDGQAVFQSTAKKLADAQESSVETVQRILNERLGKIVKIFVNRTRTAEKSIQQLEKRVDDLATELETVASMWNAVFWFDLLIVFFVLASVMIYNQHAQAIERLTRMQNDSADEHAKDD
jgi:hypothetical protein